MQYHISDGMCCAKVFPFAVVGEDKVFLFLSKIGGAALIHLVAVLCIIEQQGENTHITHLGRTAAGFVDILDNDKYAFLDDRGMSDIRHGCCHYGQPAFQSAEQLCITPVCHRLECHFPVCSKASQEEK